MKTLVIIPAYNEEASIAKTMSALLEEIPDIDYIIVNDGSKDSTAAICRENKYRFLDLPTNLGLAGAFQTGLKYAYKHGYDCAIQFDADGQHQPQFIGALEEGAKTSDIVIGSRFVNNPKPSSMRMLGSNLIEFTIKATTGTDIKDPTSGMRAFNKKMIAIMATNENLGPEPDTIAYLIKKANATIQEMPAEMKEREAGESYLTASVSISYMLRMMISILFIQFFRKKIA